jgi:hypothetical protein
MKEAKKYPIQTTVAEDVNAVIEALVREKEWTRAKILAKLVEWTMRQLDRAGSLDAMLRMDLPLTSPERIAKDAELLRAARPTKARKSSA